MYDSKAIAFECLVEDTWTRVGYMVSEVLPDVHEAINNKSIVSVELDWVRFITHWSRSTPGWFCGVKIFKKGPWSKVCLGCRSTVQ